MRKLLAFLMVWLAMSLWGQSASAQNCPPGVAQSAVCGLQSAINVQLGDAMWGFQFGQTPHTRQITVGQILNTPGSGVYLPFTGGLLTGPITVPGMTINGSVSGSWSASGFVTFNGGVNLGNGPTILNPILTFPNAVFGSLPPVNTTNLGMQYFDRTCQNGAEGAGAGSGCNTHVNNLGAWVDTPYPPNYTISIGGIAVGLVPGASIGGQGNGGLLQTATGAFVSGHCPQYNAGGALVDSGGACGAGGGGSGTVTTGSTNQIPWYAAPGTTLSPLSVVANGVLGWTAGGVPLVSTTLPSGLTCPTCTLSNATLTGTTTQGTTNHTGLVTFTAATTSRASANVPLGVAPTSPNNGDIWAIATAFQVHINGGNAGLAMTAAGGLLSGTGVINLSGNVFTCPTCVSSTNGGAIAVNSPLTLDNTTNPKIGLGSLTHVLPINMDAQFPIHNDTYYFPSQWPFNTGLIQQIEFWTGGANSPSFTMTWQINGVNITGCTNITVSQAVNPNRAGHGIVNCSAANTITLNQSLALLITNTVGNPASVY